MRTEIHSIDINNNNYVHVLDSEQNLTMWSYGQVLRMVGLGIKDGVTQVNFSLDEKCGEAMAVLGQTENDVTEARIPKELLERDGVYEDYSIYAFVFVSDKTHGQTVYKIILNVLAIPKPIDYKSPEEEHELQNIIEVINTSLVEIRQAVQTTEDNAVVTGLDREETAQAKETVLQTEQSIKQTAEQVSKDATNSAESAKGAKNSEDKSAQNLLDLMNMIGTDIASLVGGKIPMNQIPATATTDIFEISSADELVTLDAQKGDLGELIEVVNGERTITKVWQLLGDNPTLLENWVVWGTSYAVQAGSATVAETANNSEKINGMRFVTMNYSDFKTAVKDENTIYAVDMQR